MDVDDDSPKGLASFGQDNAGELYIVLRDAGEVFKIVPR